MALDNHEIDSVVIGGGLAGLAAATYLARGGQSVALLEKSSTLGGRAISQEHQGYIFNLGAHALYEKTPGVEVLGELGISYSTGSPVGIRVLSEGGNYLAPVDTTSLLRTGLLDPAEKWEASRLLLKIELVRPETLAGISLAEWLDAQKPRPLVRRLIEATARTATYTNAPTQLSTGFFAEQVQAVARGKVFYVDGGWQTLVDGLETAARAAGVTIVTGTRVEVVEQSGGRVSGVCLEDGARYGAQAVVITGGPKDVARLLGSTESPARQTLRRWADNAVPVQAACLDIALRRLPEPRNKVALDIERPLFLSTQSEFSRATTGEARGGALLYALKYLAPSEPHDAEANRRELEEWLDRTQPGWRAEVIEQRYLPNLVVCNALVQASRGGTRGRPGPEVPSMRGLYVAGDWVGPSGMLASASLASARQAAQSILAAGVPGMLSSAA